MQAIRGSITIRSRRVVLPDGERPATIRADGGVIRAISPWEDRAVSTAGDARTIDCGELALLPGLVDAHVHVNEPGRTEWEGFRTATRAAAAGGVTTICDMPLNSIPATIDGRALAAKREAAERCVHVDVAFIGGVVPQSLEDAGRRLHELAAGGVVAFKCFLCPSGVDEFDAVSSAELGAALAALTAMRAPGSLPLFAHCEAPEELEAVTQSAARFDAATHRRHVASRPPAAERRAIERLLAAASTHAARVHVVHLADAGSVAMLRAARSNGMAVTVETGPHYLLFDESQIEDGAVQFKCAPPIRSANNREALWDALREGVIDFVATDHSPAPPDVKGLAGGDFTTAWGGIASLGLALPALWYGAQARGIGLSDVVRWLATAPADVLGLSNKGRIEIGADADFVVFDPDRPFTVTDADLHFRHRCSPYFGTTLRGHVSRVFLRGEQIFADGAFSPPRGQLLRS